MRHGRLSLAAALGALAVGASPTLARAQTVEGPQVRFDSGPQDPIPTNAVTSMFEFSASKLLALFECALDGAAPAPCSSPYTTPPLTDGPHRLEVRALDPLGIAGAWAARNFTASAAAVGWRSRDTPADRVERQSGCAGVFGAR
jgi:hypothetical protein